MALCRWGAPFKPLHPPFFPASDDLPSCRSLSQAFISRATIRVTFFFSFLFLFLFPHDLTSVDLHPPPLVASVESPLYLSSSLSRHDDSTPAFLSSPLMRGIILYPQTCPPFFDSPFDLYNRYLVICAAWTIFLYSFLLFVFNDVFFSFTS